MALAAAANLHELCRTWNTRTGAGTPATRLGMAAATQAHYADQARAFRQTGRQAFALTSYRVFAGLTLAKSAQTRA